MLFYKLNIFGINIHNPIIAEPMAVINTATAATSFAFLASGCFSLHARSTVTSIAVLNNSAENTVINNTIDVNHS